MDHTFTKKDMTSTPSAPNPVTQVDAYIASLFEALGTRDPLEVMAETPSALRRATDGVGKTKLTQPEAPGKWSLVQVIQHLADSEIVGAFRFRMVLAHDQPAIPGYDQDRWAGSLKYEQAVLEAAITELRASQAEIEESLRRCDEAIEQLDAGLGVPWDAEEMKRMVRETHEAAQQARSNRAAG